MMELLKKETGTMKQSVSILRAAAMAAIVLSSPSLAGSVSAPAAQESVMKSASFLPPAALSDQISKEQHPFGPQITAFLKTEPAPIEPTGLTRDDYLSVIAGQVKAMRTYQDADGRIVDPVEKKENYYTTPCYALSVAALAAGGRCDEALLQSGIKAMDAAVSDMANATPRDNHGDFYVWPVMLAYELYTKTVDASHIAVWTEQLKRVEKEKLYKVLARGNNWNLVNASGEFLRVQHGMTDDIAYVEKSLGIQKKHFTIAGMYKEGGKPLAYDHFSRHFLAGMMEKGYRGEHFADFQDLVWRGAWMSLFMQSPFGEMPTGHRSSHHIWNEAEQSVTYELYAAQYAAAGRHREAGAFKRAARLSLQSVKEWIRPDGSGYIVKNRYPIEARHAYQPYSAHANYNLLACTMLAQAWLFADESIQEQPAPADVGGFVVPLPEYFMVLFANAGGNYVEYDLQGDHSYNPTGLLRIHLKEGHPQLGPSDGCAKKKRGGKNISVGPEWQDAAGTWHSLADQDTPPMITVLKESPEESSFELLFKLEGVDVRQTIVVNMDGVTITDQVEGTDVKAMRVVYPMLAFDGLDKTDIQLGEKSAQLKLHGKGVEFTMLSPDQVTLKRSEKQYMHANGMIEPLTVEFSGNKAVYNIQAIRTP
jgi:hypothetical protein